MGGQHIEPPCRVIVSALPPGIKLTQKRAMNQRTNLTLILTYMKPLQ